MTMRQKTISSLLEDETVRTRAIIYCRVSSKQQVLDGSGLESQQHRCEKYAEDKGYIVDKVFPDDVSGAGDFMKRKGMVSLLKFLQSKPKVKYVVIFDDLKRFSRDVMFYWMLRAKLEKYGAKVECLNFRIENSPEGRFLETIVAAGGELERNQNTRQTLQKTKARFEQGYWAKRAPIGYRFTKTREHGKLLVRDEPIASIIQEALEGYATGRFQTLTEIKLFLDDCPSFPKGGDGKVHPQRVRELLDRPVYAGVVEMVAWGVSMRKGHHEGIISLECYNKIQDRLEGRAIAPTRKNLNEDFPLRGSVLCATCNTPLTASWSKGRKARYAYYLCRERSCENYGKSIKKDQIEGDFVLLLEQLRPSGELFSVVEKMFTRIWNLRSEYQKERLQTLKLQEKKVQRDINSLLDRIVQATSEAVISAYELRVHKLEEEKALIQERLENGAKPIRDFKTTFRTALSFLANPHVLWSSERYEDKRAVLKLTFSDNLLYDRNSGFRTAKTTLPFKVLDEFSGLQKGMVPRGGIEPPTRGFSVPCSTD